MNGFTGFNREQLVNQLEAIATNRNSVEHIILDGRENIEKYLVEKWYGPKAVTFGEFLNRAMLTIFDEVENEYNRFLRNTLNAANAWCNSQEIEPIPESVCEFGRGVPSLENSFKAQGPNGEIGMSTKDINSEFASIINNTSTNALLATDALIREAALYDQDGSQNIAFSNLRLNIIEKIKDNLSSIATELNLAIATEIDIATQAASQATSTIGGEVGMGAPSVE